MEPGRYYGSITQGDDYELDLEWKDEQGTLVDLTGWSAEFVIREYDKSPRKLVDVSSASGNVTFGVGTIHVRLPTSMTQDLNYDQVFHALKLVDTTGTVYPLLCGNLTVNRGFQ